MKVAKVTTIIFVYSRGLTDIDYNLPKKKKKKKGGFLSSERPVLEHFEENEKNKNTVSLTGCGVRHGQERNHWPLDHGGSGNSRF
jgi:hypothetical protein